MTIDEELRGLAEANRGQLTPDQVVQAARVEGTALHKHFLARGAWDDPVAAGKYRVALARELIRTCRVIVTTETLHVPAPYFVRDPASAPGQGYSTLPRLRSNEENARAAVIDEFKRAAAALTRARAIAVALRLEDDIDEILAEMDAFTNGMHPPPDDGAGASH